MTITFPLEHVRLRLWHECGTPTPASPGSARDDAPVSVTVELELELEARIAEPVGPPPPLLAAPSTRLRLGATPLSLKVAAGLELELFA
jgi:hypothetical protein